MQDTELQNRLKDIGQIFNINAILNREVEDPAAIARYYRRNRLAYSLFNSRKGFVHMGISHDGTHKSSDFYEQGRIIKGYLEQLGAKVVLELAPGKAATTEYLAESMPETKFYRVDLPNGQLDIAKYKNKPNLTLTTGDYHDLARYASDSLDAVYIIEALCYARDRRKVISEVSRVLKPKGYFIIFDGYYQKPESSQTDDEKLAARLLLKSMMVTEANHNYSGLKKELEAARLLVTHEEDLSEEIMPSLLRLENIAKKYIRRPRLARVAKRLFSDEFLGNAVAGYLFPLLVREGIFNYQLTVSQKSDSN